MMPKTILIVEDSETCAETLQIALEEMPGVVIRVALSGREALRILTETQGEVSVVVTDLQMPSMTGLDLLETLKRDPTLMRIPIVLISGDSDPGLPRRALHCGAHSFFNKPFSPVEVRKRLEEILQ